MKKNTLEVLNELETRYPVLSDQKENILNAYLIIENAYKNNKKLLLCGNGGSAADSEHVVGELLKSFKKRRRIKEERIKSMS